MDSDVTQGVHHVDHASEIFWKMSHCNVAENLILLMGSFIPDGEEGRRGGGGDHPQRK